MIYPLTSKDFTFQAHKSVKSADRGDLCVGSRRSQPGGELEPLGI